MGLLHGTESLRGVSAPLWVVHSPCSFRMSQPQCGSLMYCSPWGVSLPLHGSPTGHGPSGISLPQQGLHVVQSLRGVSAPACVLHGLASYRVFLPLLVSPIGHKPWHESPTAAVPQGSLPWCGSLTGCGPSEVSLPWHRSSRGSSSVMKFCLPVVPPAMSPPACLLGFMFSFS